MIRIKSVFGVLAVRSKFIYGHRSAEQETLKVLAAVVEQKLVLFGGFNAFGDHFQLQLVGQGDDDPGDVLSLIHI